MEKTMNLVSMLLLFIAIVGFDHFYQGVIKHQNSGSLPKVEVQKEHPQNYIVMKSEKKLAQVDKIHTDSHYR